MQSVASIFMSLRMSKQSQENYYKELLNMWIELNLPLIDLRPHTEFMKIHLLDTGNIPVDQLNDRAHMLPPKKSELCILGTEEEIAKVWFQLYSRLAVIA
jgi:rhodanese-related sulfurtransferase